MYKIFSRVKYQVLTKGDISTTFTHVAFIKVYTKFDLVQAFLQIKVFKICNKIWECEPLQSVISAKIDTTLNVQGKGKLKKRSKKKKNGNCKMTFQAKSINHNILSLNEKRNWRNWLTFYRYYNPVMIRINFCHKKITHTYHWGHMESVWGVYYVAIFVNASQVVLTQPRGS